MPFRPSPPRPEPQHAAMSDQNRAFGQKADWTCDHPHKKKNEGTFNYRNISSEGLILHYSFILIRKIQTATRQICNHFVKDGSHATLPTQCTCHRFHLQSLQLAMLPARSELSAIQQYSLLNCALCPQSSCHSNTEFFKLGHSSSWHDFRGASCR